MASRGQIIPLNNIRGKQEPTDIFMASMEVLQTTDKNIPKLIPAKPAKMVSYLLKNIVLIPWKRVRRMNQVRGPRHGSLKMRNTVMRVMLAW